MSIPLFGSYKRNNQTIIVLIALNEGKGHVTMFVSIKCEPQLHNFESVGKPEFAFAFLLFPFLKVNLHWNENDAVWDGFKISHLLLCVIR